MADLNIRGIADFRAQGSLQTAETLLTAVEGRVADNQPASTAATLADLVTDFNTLLTNLKAAGLMVAD